LTQKETRLRALERQIARLDERLAALQQRSNRLSNIRLWVVVTGLPAVWLTFFTLQIEPGLVLGLVLIVVFAAVVRVHRRVNAARDAHALYRAIKARHAARIRLDWDALPPARRGSVPANHPFATDLDLVGEWSLHRLLDTTASREGSQRLLDWLLAESPDPAAITTRQALVHELIPLTRFRDRLTLAAARDERGLSAQWSGEKLLASLAEQSQTAQLRGTLLVLLVLAALNIGLFLLDVLAGWPPLWIGTLLIYGVLNIVRRDLVGDLFGDALTITDSLRRLGTVLDYLERYPYPANSGLAALCAPIAHGAARPSTLLRRVTRVASAASLQSNFFLWLPVNAIFPWDMFFAYRLNRHREALADRLPVWLDVWYEVEALNALANFAYLNPGYTFPTIMDQASPVLQGEQMGHPLIPYTEKACNDFTLAQGEAVIVTGSNMSGKSSFLRTIGVNLSLAYAGSVVDAAAMQVGLFRLFTCIRVTDSVIDGISYFYAEVKRLKALLNALDGDADYPLFFLIDEIFRGTNNRERLIGSRAYIRALTGRGGTGLVATHDLELVHLADHNPAIRNQHFRETVAEGRMHFDYTLREGPCPTTNALVIMELEGLPINGE
jgi:hypothetical protein